MVFVIAIDGPAAAGKGTLSRGLSARLGMDVLETGLLYRAVARLAIDAGTDTADHRAVTRLSLGLTPDDLALPSLRGETTGCVASIVSCIPGVRAALLKFQRDFAATPPRGNGAILDGRDIGTVICPNADLKLYVVADIGVRVKRRYAESMLAGELFTLAEIEDSIRARDDRESSRKSSPMKPAADALIIDTSMLNTAEVLEIACAEVAARLIPGFRR
jgi:cytidylate kinase